jgi:hypothetical protein
MKPSKSAKSKTTTKHSEFQCDICNFDMECIKTSIVENLKHKKFRKRRLQCTNDVCGYQKVVYGNGNRDENMEYKQLD